MAIERKMKYVGKCPKCELNYIKENEELCSVCRRKSFFIENEFSSDSYSQERWKKLKEIEERQRQKEKQNKEELLNIMKSFGFEGFCHTANLNNFIDIYKSGFLKSRNLLEEEGFVFEDNSNMSVIEKTGEFIKKQVRFYYRPITPTNIGAYIKFNQKHPVLMVFDESLLYDECYFSEGCPAGYNKTIHKNISRAKKFNWEKIFETGYFDTFDDESRNYRNSEFLVPHKVPISKIKKIYFKCENDMKLAIEKIGKDERFVVDETKFYKENVW